MRVSTCTCIYSKMPHLVGLCNQLMNVTLVFMCVFCCFFPSPAHSQHALRLIAFDKLHLVLGVDPLPPPGTARSHPSSQQKQSSSEKEGGESESTPSSGGGAPASGEVTSTTGVKRELSEAEKEPAEGVKKVKLES